MTAPKVWDGNLAKWDVRNLTVSDDQCVCKINVPGLSLGDYDRNRLPKLTSVIFPIMCSRHYVQHVPYNSNGDVFMDWQRVVPGKMFFASSMKLTFSKALYSFDTDKSRFDAKHKLDFVGPAMSIVTSELYSKDVEDEPLVTQTDNVVLIEAATRTITTYPDWFCNKFGNKVPGKRLVLRPFDRPANTFAYGIKVKWSDTDAYNHTTYRSYFRFAEDAIHAALNPKSEDCNPSALNGLTDEIIQNGLKGVEITYQNESSECQQLTAYVWQDKQEGRYVFRCSIEKGDTRVAQLKLEYHS